MLAARRLKTGLLAVADQNGVTGLGDFRAVLLQAGQNDEIALIHDLATELLHVARTGSLFLRGAAALGLLREGAGRRCHQEHGGDQGKFKHRRPSFFL
jgi:hypothetical protein